MNWLWLFLTEGRHVFSICTTCGKVHRLSDLRLSAQGTTYESDWMDELEQERRAVEERRKDLESKRREHQAEARRKAEREQLPVLLRRVAPFLGDAGIDPRDVRVLFEPAEFVVFRGMNSDEGVSSVEFVHLGPRTDVLGRIRDALARRDVGWVTLRVDEDGTIAAHHPPGRPSPG